MDLYANEWQTFRRVTLPLVLPGILAAALLAFSLSFDDFIITNFNQVLRSPSRCTSGVRRSAASRRRSTSSARRCSWSRSPWCSGAECDAAGHR